MKMHNWLRKSLVVLFTISTFGLVTPPNALMVESTSTKGTQIRVINSEEKIDESKFSVQEEEYTFVNDFESIFERIEEQSFKKFGNKIGHVIEEEFKVDILPKIYEVILLAIEKDERFKYVTVTDNPSGGKSEKIFHISSQETGETLMKFHVRREQRPLEGHWFNFHYHTIEDKFEHHHDLGSIYWDKNTPPHWQIVH